MIVINFGAKIRHLFVPDEIFFCTKVLTELLVKRIRKILIFQNKQKGG